MNKFEITTDNFGDMDTTVTVEYMQNHIDSLPMYDGWDFKVEQSGDELRLCIYRNEDFEDEGDSWWNRAYTMVTDDYGYMVIGKMVKTTPKVNTTKIQNTFNEYNAAVLYDGEYIRIAEEDGFEGGYILRHHKGAMPAFASDHFDTIEELIVEMKSFANLRKWGKLYDAYGKAK